MGEKTPTEARPVRLNRTATVITAMLCATGEIVGHWHANAGPLEPPASAFDGLGSPQETPVSLADIDAKIEALAASSIAGSDPGPWEIFRIPPTGATAANRTAVLVAEGPVYVKSMTTYLVNISAFDGPGSIDTLSNPETSNWIGRDTNTLWGTTQGHAFASTVPVEQICENGLYAAWIPHSVGRGHAYILYRPVEEE